MKLLVLTITFFCIASSLFSQTIFEKGYIIDNSNDKINCFIKDLNWLDNPESFEYKIQIDGEVLTGLAENIKEFGILNYVKYRRFSVDIDQSSNNINQLNSERNPVFVNQTVFLKSIIEGNASLFEYSKGNLNRYFFSLDTSDIKPLIYKQYRNQDYKVEENATFRQTLYNAFKCSELSLNNFKYLKYNSNELKKIFIKYNECTGDQYEIVEHQK